MKGRQHPTNDITINPSRNESIRDVIDRTSLGRRQFVKTGIQAATLAALGGVTMRGIIQTVEAAVPPSLPLRFGGIGFESIPPSVAPVADRVAVPSGYTVNVLASWGDPIMPGAPEWAEGATQDAVAQAMQFGMHNDGMYFFPIDSQGGYAPGSATGYAAASQRGVLCVNHEYTHEAILHGPDGLDGGGVTLAKVRKSQAAHGVAAIEIENQNGRWTVNRQSPLARRITANTPLRLAGPAAGHRLLKSKQFDIFPQGVAEVGVNDGFTGFGTMNNCANGYTPWGTYLTCEENWNGYFAAPSNGTAIGPEFAGDKTEIIRGFNRYGITNTGSGNVRWHEVDPRFNADTNPLEPHHFGWVVEIDPTDPASVPVKRTALGRMKHESAEVAVSVGNRVAVYMGDDERNEYIYKFVCAQPYNRYNRSANRDLLDQGTLYVAKFTDTAGSGSQSFRGQWIPLVPGSQTVIADPANPGQTLRLRDVEAFKAASDEEVQALILIRTRQAADAVGATMMDRPEWVAVRTYDRRRGLGRLSGTDDYPSYSASYPLELYCTLTNNDRRGGGNASAPAATSGNSPDGSTAAAAARPPVDAANPRPDNDFGHIIRWREDNNVVTALGFEWDIFVLCGDTKTAKTLSNLYATSDLSGVGYLGSINDAPAGSTDFGAPDGLWFDQFGRLWIQTDQVGNATGDWVNIGANIMACADPNTKEIRRFLTAPPNSEVTGIANTPDGTALFVGIQHPGEDSPASNPTQFSNWPQSQFVTNSAGVQFLNTPGLRRPQSSVLVITRQDGGVVGD